jgi:O-antigen/teichoic acid export membrane protein
MASNGESKGGGAVIVLIIAIVAISKYAQAATWDAALAGAFTGAFLAGLIAVSCVLLGGRARRIAARGPRPSFSTFRGIFRT